MKHPPNPYVGARALERTDGIFGRDRERPELLDLLIAERILVLHAPSGAGKTSLVRAGLVPDLEKAGFLVLPLTRVHTSSAEPRASLLSNPYADALLASIRSTRSQAELNSLGTGEDLRSALSKLAEQQNTSPECPVVLIVDQFEELLTTGSPDPIPKREFLNQLAEVIKDRRWWLLLSMREDYLPLLDAMLHRTHFRYKAHYRLDLLVPEQATEAITGPANNCGISFTKGAAARLVRDLHPAAGGRTSESGPALAGQLIDPMQLQLVCFDLWETLPEGSTEITLEHLQGRVDVDRTLMAFYDDTVAAVALKQGIDEKNLRDWFGGCLITESDTRGIVFQGPTTSGGIPNTAVHLLVKERLLRAEPRAGGIWYELPHDRLIKPIRKANAYFAEQSQRIAEEYRRKAARKREYVLLAAGLIVALGVAWTQWTDYKNQRQSSSQQLLTVAGAPTGVKDLVVSLLAYQQESSSEAEAALREALRRPYPSGVFEFHGPVHRATISSDGHYVAAIDSAGALRLWRDGTPLPIPVAASGGKVSALGFSPGTGYLVLGFKNGELRILTPGSWQLTDTARLTGEPAALAFHADGKRLAVATRNGQIDIGLLPRWVDPSHLPASDLSSINGLAFSPTEGGLLISVHHDSAVVAWNWRTRSRIDTLWGHKGYVYAVAFHPSQPVFATSSKDKSILVWTRDSPSDSFRVLTRLLHHSDNVNDLGFSPDGSLLVSGGRDELVAVWNVKAGWQHMADLDHHRGPIRAVRFSGGGDEFLTAAEDSTLILWAANGSACDSCSGEQLADTAQRRLNHERSLLNRSVAEQSKSSSR